MIKLIEGVARSIVLVAATASAIYAVRPDLRRWVEINLVSRDAYYYIGAVQFEEGAGRFSEVQFYSTRWDIGTGRIKYNPTDGIEDAWDVLETTVGEGLVAVPYTSDGPLPGRLTPEPLGELVTVAQSNDCFMPVEMVCRRRVIENDRVLYRPDETCAISEEAVDSDGGNGTISLWMKAVKFTCS